MSTGSRVVGAPTGETAATEGVDDHPEESTSDVESKPGDGVGQRGARSGTNRRLGRSVAVPAVAVLGLIGTLVFGLLWAGAPGSGQSNAAMQSAATAFLKDLTNFNAKSVDGDFSSISSMATGTFSTQATKFFNSSIRTELESALAESRGQIRDLYTQSYNGTTGSVYAVVDQVYVNNKISTPQSDVLRVVVNLAKVGSVWKISDVTVLEGATPASTGTTSGSAGSSVAGQ